MTTLISSQRFLDDALVAEKAETLSEWIVTLSPVFTWDGEDYQTILDGHHALAAAQQSGGEPTYQVASAHECGEIDLLAAGDVLGFLEATRCDTDWYDAETGNPIF